MHAGVDLVGGDLIPFFQAGDGDLVVVYADAIQPFFFLGDMEQGDERLGRCLHPVLREIGGGKRYLNDLTDRERLGERHVIKKPELFGGDVIQAAETIPVFLYNYGMFQV